MTNIFMKYHVVKKGPFSIICRNEENSSFGTDLQTVHCLNEYAIMSATDSILWFADSNVLVMHQFFVSL